MTAIAAANSKQLLAAVQAHNTAHPDGHVAVNWGREGNKSTWFAHAEHGSRLKTGLRFSEVVDYVNREIELSEPAA